MQDIIILPSLIEKSEVLDEIGYSHQVIFSSFVILTEDFM